MDIKETSAIRAISDVAPSPGTSAVLDRNAPPAKQTDSSVIVDQISYSGTRNTPSASDFRLRANQVIEAINLADSATAEIGKLAESVGGIVDQVSDPKTPAARVAILEKEANQLVAAIKSQVEKTTESGVQPLAGDPIKLVVEKELGKTLSFLLPIDGKENFGLGTVKFSTIESIIQTRATVANAKERIEQLRSAVTTTRSEVASALGRAEVALQNSEAAKSSVRDVDSAVDLLANTSSQIRSSPEAALDSAGQLRGDAL